EIATLKGASFFLNDKRPATNPDDDDDPPKSRSRFQRCKQVSQDCVELRTLLNCEAIRYADEGEMAKAAASILTLWCTVAYWRYALLAQVRCSTVRSRRCPERANRTAG